MNTWIKIHGFVGYEVSDHGQVRSWRPERNNVPPPLTPRILNPALTPGGYRQVGLYTLGVRFGIHVKNLVCEAFHGPRPDGMVVRHLNGKRTDDRADNLTWGTPQQNSDDMQRHGTQIKGEAVHTARLNELDVLSILRSSEPVSVLAEKHGVTKGAIYHIRHRRSWKHVDLPDA